MDHGRRELLAARVASGILRLQVVCGSGRPASLLARQPGREERYAAQEIYHEALHEALLTGSYSDDELLAFLRRERLWADRDQAELDALEKDIEEVKTKLVGLVYRTYERKQGKLFLGEAKARQAALLARRHAFDHLTAAGAAAMARQRYLLACSLHWPGGGRVVPAESLWADSSAQDYGLLEAAFEAYLEARLDEAEIRELARTEPWHSVWASRGAAGVFGVPAADLTDEQLRLQVWSQMYENIHGHPECPPQEVLDDDDACDGWLILQKRKRDADTTRRRADAVASSEKIRNAEEVYIPVDSLEDARRVEELNDEQARRVKGQRRRQVESRGAVQHADLADVRQDCRMQAAREGAAAAKGR